MKKKILSLVLAFLLLLPVIPAEASELPEGTENFSYSFTSIDGGSISTKSGGKPKLIVFFMTACSRCRNTLSDISSSDWLKNGDTDVCAIEIARHSQEEVREFQEEYCPEGLIQFAADESFHAKKAADQYNKAAGAMSGHIPTPLIAMVDTENMLRFVAAGSITAAEIREYLPKLADDGNEAEGGNAGDDSQGDDSNTEDNNDKNAEDGSTEDGNHGNNSGNGGNVDGGESSGAAASREEAVAAALPDTSFVGGVETAMEGVYLATGVNGSIVTTSAEDISGAYGLAGSEKPYGKFYNFDGEKSPMAKDTVDSAVAAQDAAAGPMLNIELGKMDAGKYGLLPSDGSAIRLTLGLPENFVQSGKTYAVICVRTGGVYSVLPDLDSSPDTVTFDTTGGAGVYAIIKK